MRKIGDFKTEKYALRFWSFLKQNKIESALEEVSSEEIKSWEIWVTEEDQINTASAFLEEFNSMPDDEKFASSPSHSKDREEAPQNSHGRFKQFNLSKRWGQMHQSPGTATLFLIVISVAVFLISNMGKNMGNVSLFFISREGGGELSEFMSGQIWRLITPIFLHFHIFHILFNMYWLYDLGSQIEHRKGPKFYITFVIIIAFISNLLQFYLSGGNYQFGGMSGVIYGLFGYVWVKTRLDPGDGFRLDPTVAAIMFGFLIICFTGAFGQIANWAHTGGLLVGLAWGYASAYRWNSGRN